MKLKNFFLLILGVTLSILVSAQDDTYKVGNTEYYIGKYYSTTGKPMVKRNSANKRAFLKSRGYDRAPYGYEIDHIVPLSEGGSDSPSNMQLLTIEQHARKTARERTDRSNSTYSTYSIYNSNSTYDSSPTYNSTKTHLPSNRIYNGRTIYTGKNGGKYYINRNGNKTYLKSKSNNSSPTNYYSPKYKSSSPTYKSGRVILTGPRGGKYYINTNGNKTYIKG